MKHKYWWIFGAIQLMGLFAGLEGLYLPDDPLLWSLSLLLLLPGTLISYPFSTLGHGGMHWPLWIVYAVAVTVNLLLFALASSLISRIRKSK